MQCISLLMRKFHDPEGLAEIGMPAEKKAQSRVGKRIMVGFTNDFGDDPIEAMNRQVIDEKNLNSVQPDVVFHEKGNPIAVVVIEIEDHKEFKKCKDAVKEHLENYPDVKEGFAYNIDKDKWVRYTREGEDITEEKDSSYSEYLSTDFADYFDIEEIKEMED